MKKLSLAKLALALALMIAFAFGSVLMSKWQHSKQWIGVASSSVDPFFTQTVGEFKSRSECQMEMKKRFFHSSQAEQKVLADQFFCARSCWIDVFVGQVTIEDYECAEKHRESLSQ